MTDAGLAVTGFFTDRSGGVGEPPYDTLNLSDAVGDSDTVVKANRKILEERAGAKLTFLNSVHGATVAVIDTPGAKAPEADILVSVTPGVALVTLAADCVPVLMHDPKTGAVAAAHIGRQGLYDGAVDNVVAAIADLRGEWGNLGTVTAVIGPAICGRCYEVPPLLREQVASRHASAFATTKWGTPSLDLPRAIEARMSELGVTVVRIARCTFEDPDLFSRRMHGETGRQAGVIVCS